MDLIEINSYFKKNNSLIINIENYYSSLLNKNLVCFEVKTEEDKEIFENKFLEKISQEYSEMIYANINSSEKITFIVVSKDYVDQHCEGILYYAIH